MFKNWPLSEKILVIVCLFLLAGLFIFIATMFFTSCTPVTTTFITLTPADTNDLQQQLTDANTKFNEASNQTLMLQAKVKQYEDDNNRLQGLWWDERLRYEAARKDADNCHADNMNYQRLLDEANSKLTIIKAWMTGIVDGSDNLTAAGMTDPVKTDFRQDFKEIYLQLPDWAR